MITIYDERNTFGEALPVSEEVKFHADALFAQSPFYYTNSRFYERYGEIFFANPIVDSVHMDEATFTVLMDTDMNRKRRHCYVNAPALTVGMIAYALARYPRLFANIEDQITSYIDFVDNIDTARDSSLPNDEVLAWVFLSAQTQSDSILPMLDSFVEHNIDFDTVVRYVSNGSRNANNIIHCIQENIDPHLAYELEDNYA